MKRLVGIGTTLGIVAMAMSFGMFSKPFEANYKVAKGSELNKAACGVCHAGAKGGKLNGYGADLAAAMKAKSSKKLTPEILAMVESKDSDGDGVKNIDEIKKDKNPGAK